MTNNSRFTLSRKRFFYKKGKATQTDCLSIFIGSVETRRGTSLHQPIVIYCMTVTRLTTTPSSVLTRTLYMPALNWAMFRM